MVTCNDLLRPKVNYAVLKKQKQTKKHHKATYSIFSFIITFLKWHNHGDKEQINGYQWLQMEGKGKGERRGCGYWMKLSSFSTAVMITQIYTCNKIAQT